jgi:hypothetical protein
MLLLRRRLSLLRGPEGVGLGWTAKGPADGRVSGPLSTSLDLKMMTYRPRTHLTRWTSL